MLTAALPRAASASPGQSLQPLHARRHTLQGLEDRQPPGCLILQQRNLADKNATLGLTVARSLNQVTNGVTPGGIAPYREESQQTGLTSLSLRQILTPQLSATLVLGTIFLGLGMEEYTKPQTPPEVEVVSPA